MSDRLPIHSMYPNPIRPGQAANAGSPTRTQAGANQAHVGNTSFKEILQQKILHFSQHAETRLRQRGISFKSEQIEQINAAIDKAAAKGANDSLVLIKDTALIVNVKNRTVITAMDSQSLKDHVFTQIDSAVIIP
jgi:flagellar operon protein